METDARVLARVVSGLRELGYIGALIEEQYKFRDWFSVALEEREAAAVAFGETPVSYDSACVGVVCANGVSNRALVNKYRALGAPVVLEIDGKLVREWAVSKTEAAHGLVATHEPEQLKDLFVARAPEWKPRELLRLKNIGAFERLPQLGLFSGVIPELEQQIQSKLDPLLRAALTQTKEAYQSSTNRPPAAEPLLKLTFWILTAKVFHDRRVGGFANMEPDSDAILTAVAKQYKAEPPRLLNKEAREAATKVIWTSLDFRNLSVEVLSEIWSTTLVDVATRKALGIHRTPRTLVRYVVDKIPFDSTGVDERIVLEPCSGSGAFLIGAMHKLRATLFGMQPSEQHRYFAKHLVGIEKDPFGVEISRLALTLADFPHPGDWEIRQADVYDSDAMLPDLRRAGVVLCNPPFETFSKKERTQYDLDSPKKPVELLRRVLDGLHPMGVIGFVLPRAIIDGRGYRKIRRRLAERFERLEITALPDKAFPASPESALLVATEPIPHNVSRVISRKVKDSVAAWQKFATTHEVSTDHVAQLAAELIEERLGVPDLPEVWDFLIDYSQLGEHADLRRGIEWGISLTRAGVETGDRSLLVRNTPAPGFHAGVAPRTKFNAFEIPPARYLNLQPEFERAKAFNKEWKRPKVIVNKSTRSRGNWRLAAFADVNGLVFYQTFIGVWPTTDRYDVTLLAAILNSPIANAFVSAREGKTDITLETLKLLPMPNFTDGEARRLRSLVERYSVAANAPPLMATEPPEALLKELDAVVLNGYHLPPRLERLVLDWFRGQERQTGHAFTDYFPADFDVFFSLSEYLSASLSACTAEQLSRRMEEFQG